MNPKYKRHYEKDIIEKGDICFLDIDKIDKISKPLKEFIGKKCVVVAVYDKVCRIKFENGFESISFKDNLKFDDDYRKIKKELKLKKEEQKLRMKDVDPWGEEDWMTENYATKITDPSILSIGNVIHHPVYGEGFIISLRSNKLIAKIKFKRGGEKEMRTDIGILSLITKEKEHSHVKWYSKGKLGDEEDWVNERFYFCKYKKGDVVYHLSRFSMLSKYNGKSEILDKIQSGDNYYRIKCENGEVAKWIREDDLFSSEKEFNEEKEKRDKIDFLYKEKQDKIKRKQEELKLKMKEIDPWGEEDWTSESKINERKIAYNKKLCPDLWEDDVLKEKIRNKLMRIANDFYEDMDLDVELLDVYLTGSIANYNYNAESDIDVHLIIDYTEINDDIDLVEKAVDGERYVWNLRHNITMQGHDVEIYVQDINAKHDSSGVYSIMNDKWVKKPVYNRPNMDQVDVDNKYDARVSDIIRFEKVSKHELDPEDAEMYYKSARQLKKRIMKDRSDGLNIIGEFSLENLVFKKLRKTGKFKKLIDTISRLYDKIYSQ